VLEVGFVAEFMEKPQIDEVGHSIKGFSRCVLVVLLYIILLERQFPESAIKPSLPFV